MNLVAESETAQAQFLSIVSIDIQGHDNFAEALAAGIEYHSQAVFPRRNIELVLVVERMFFELLQVLLVFEIQIRRIAEARSDGVVGAIGNSQHVNRGVLLPLL